jgi:hypothetical protein
MKWPLTKRHAPLAIPEYPVALVEVLRTIPIEVGMSVEKHDTSAMTMTGVHKAWKRMS